MTVQECTYTFAHVVIFTNYCSSATGIGLKRHLLHLHPHQPRNLSLFLVVELAQHRVVLRQAIFHSCLGILVNACTVR